jgi:uncharacterized protein YceH (UPF0502 family)
MNSFNDESRLTAEEARVLGSLVEKAITTPDYYPLSLNALVNACNQSSNRDPVVAYGEPTVLRALESLRGRKLVFIFEGAASRVAKYGQKFAETLGLSPAEAAALVVLMLRGPQTVGEIRGRSGRLHEFASIGEVESTLQALAARSPQPLVVRLPRQLGYKESRYAHLLSGPPEAAALVSAAGAEATVPASAEAAAPAGGSEGEATARLEQEIESLRREVAELKAQFAAFKQQLE